MALEPQTLNKKTEYTFCIWMNLKLYENIKKINFTMYTQYMFLWKNKKKTTGFNTFRQKKKKKKKMCALSAQILLTTQSFV